MNINECAAKAVLLKQSGGYNCCQAVTAALSELLDIPDDRLYDVAAGFCVGMGSMEATCGALIGAGMIAGIQTKGKAAVRYTRQLAQGFKEMCGAMTCKDLKGVDTGTVLCPCDECVRNAVLAYAKVLPVQDVTV